MKKEPLGVVMVIAPWNYPYLTAVNTIVPALMAGNAVILKHAAQTLLVGERFAKAFEKAGLPKGVFQNIVLNHAQTEKLLGSGKIDHVNFTGSVAGGRAIEKAAAGTFMTLGLELGGKDPAYVLPDAKLDHAVANLVDGAFFNSGQCCCGIERIYVHEKVYDDFVEGFVAETQELCRRQPARRRRPRWGRWRRRASPTSIREQKAEALRKGAKAHVNMKVADDKAGSPYLAPEVLTDVDHQMSVMREESFGPIVGIMKVRNDEEAIALMNDSPYGLTASIWTARHRARGGDRRPRRDRHGVHEPLRLSRPGAGLDRRQGHRQGRGAVGDRLRQSDAAEDPITCAKRSECSKAHGRWPSSSPTGTIRPPSASAPAASRNCRKRSPRAASSGRCSSPIPAWPSCRSSPATLEDPRRCRACPTASSPTSSPTRSKPTSTAGIAAFKQGQA